MDGIENNTATCYLPHDIIENILCRLPVKSLLRFRCVCKQWKATISDPKVARTHLRLSKNSSSSSSSCLLNLFGYKTAVEHVDFAKDEFRLVSSIDYPSVKDPDTGILCHCDGLYLIPCLLDHPSARARDYALWNPSRRSYKKLNGCPIIDKYVTWISGICYDPLVKDYKVVIGEGNSYAVFNCGNNCWSELKEMTNIDMEESTGWRGNHAVSYNGSVYWICYSVKEHDRLKIVYFDGRDEEFKNLCKLDVGAEVAQMISLEDEGLCLFTYYKFRGCWRSREMVFMKKLVNGVGEEEWKEEVKVELPAYDYRSWRCVWPVCCTHGNKIVVRLEYSHSGQDYLLYDVTKRSFATIQNAPPDSLNYYNMFPYVENLATFA